MSAGDLAPPVMGGAPDITAAAGDLVRRLIREPEGQVSPSVYETGRLVTLAPWLTGHAARVDYLLAAQRADGGWGGPDGYALVPTLSATEALLTAGRGGPEASGKALHRAVARGLHWLRGRTAGTEPLELPDMPAIELIVPSLIEMINRHLEVPLPLPAGMSELPLGRIRALLSTGAEIPEKILHALEVGGDAAGRTPAVVPTRIGTVGASPAATAAWLNGGRDATGQACRYLEAVVHRYGGPVPVGFPITVFERGWTLSWLLRTGIPVTVPAELVAGLRAAVGPAGAPGGEGLPADADSTSVALYALSLLGAPYALDCLDGFDTGTHFCTWPGEQGFSVSVNAHVLDAVGRYVATGAAEHPRYPRIVARLSRLLREHQREDGSWTDRWHASPYYATVCCVLALADFGDGGSAEALDRAARWVLETQRDDGSWGHWTGTAEETAYALHVLLRGRSRGSAGDADPAWTAAVARGHSYLIKSVGTRHVPLWHDKDLYAPTAIIEAAILAARRLIEGAHLAGG